MEGGNYPGYPSGQYCGSTAPRLASTRACKAKHDPEWYPMATQSVYMDLKLTPNVAPEAVVFWGAPPRKQGVRGGAAPPPPAPRIPATVIVKLQGSAACGVSL